MRHWINMLLLSRENSSLTFSSREYALAATVVVDVFPSMAAIDLRAEPIDRPFPRCPHLRPQIRVPFACFFSSGQAPSDPGSRTMAKEGLKRHSERRLNKRLGVKQTPSMFVPGPSGLLRPMEGPEHSIMNR